MDEGERYIEGKIRVLNKYNSNDLELQKEVMFNVKTAVSDMEVQENNYQN